MLKKSGHDCWVNRQVLEHQTHWDVWPTSSCAQQWSHQHNDTVQFYDQKVPPGGHLENHDVKCSGHGMDERIGCCSNHHYNDQDWENKVRIKCESGCKSNYALDDGGHQRSMTNEICVHNLAARPDDEKLNGGHVILFEPICARYQSPLRFEIQWQGYEWNNRLTQQRNLYRNHIGCVGMADWCHDEEWNKNDCKDV